MLLIKFKVANLL